MILSACSPKLENFGNRLYQRKKELLEPVAKFDIDPNEGGDGAEDLASVSVSLPGEGDDDVGGQHLANVHHNALLGDDQASLWDLWVLWDVHGALLGDVPFDLWDRVE